MIEPASLSTVLGAGVARVNVVPLAGAGFSNATLSRVNVELADGSFQTFVLKRASLEGDWIARRTGDVRGREARLLREPAFEDIWDVFTCPYRASAHESHGYGLLMDDLSAGLLPDVREPLTADQERALLNALARLHARFWNRNLAGVDWLVRFPQYCDLLSPAICEDASEVARLTPNLRDAVPRGWIAAAGRLPPAVLRLMREPAAQVQQRWAGLPVTLLHGDVKVANFALRADRSVAAFDWAMVGAGPCAVDLGWYLAVNASRLTSSKEAALFAYRALLETALADILPDGVWNTIEDAAIFTAARMLLWSKAAALDSARAGASDEWDWWVARLTRLC